MKRVFVDTSGFVGLLLAEDAHHKRAADLWARASMERWQLITASCMVYETYSVLLSRSSDGRANALRFLDLLATGEPLVERVERVDEEKAFALVRSHTDKAYSLFDAIAFVMMKRLRIGEALAFDRHFRQYGRFTVLE